MANYYDYYRVFQCVAENGNITTAANELFMSQSTVSRTIQKLEHELGCQLLMRTRTGVGLTVEGELLYHHVRLANEHFEIVEEKIRQINQLGSGSIHIGATEMTMQYFLLPFLEQFKKDYPNIRIKISFAYPEKTISQLNSGLLDLAIVTSPLPPHPDINYMPLMEYRDILIAGEDYLYLTKEKKHLKDLQDQPFILMEPGTSAREYIDSFFREHGLEIRAEYDVSSMPMIYPMVFRNLGIAFIPTVYVHRQIGMEEVGEIHLYEELPKRQICLLTSGIYPQSAASREFVKRLM